MKTIDLQPDEYLSENGLAYCKNCHTPRVCRIEDRYFPINCKCQREAYEKAENERKMHERKAKEVLSLVKEYSKVNYCLYQFDHWPNVDGYSYSESVETDAYGLFTILSDEANNRIREDLARLRTYEEQGDDRLLIDNCLC